MSFRRSASSPAADGRLGRRSLLKAAGASALGATLLSTTVGAGRAHAAATAADVIIIGAGYAGATAARELALKGLKPLVLEAQNRIGGRVFTTTYAGAQVEAGAGWLGPQQPLIHAELRRYNIGTYEDVAAEQFILPGNQGFQTLDPAAALTSLDQLWSTFYSGSANYFERPYDPLYRADLLQSVDPLSLADRLGKLSLSPTEKQWLNSETSVYSGGSSSLGALTGMAQWIQLAGGTYGEYTTTMSLRPVGGMIAVLQKMLTEAKADVRLSSPVKKVTQSGGTVTVETTSGATFTAPAVVVATPTNTWKNITFSPGLPTAHKRASSEGIGIPHATKVWVHVQGSIPPSVAQAGEGSPILMMVPQVKTAKGRLYVAFTGPSLDVANASAVQTAVQQLLPGTTVLEYQAMEWAKQQYTGGWGLRRPGQLLGLFPAIEQPHGRILFAGGDIAKGWHGAFIEGAIESGFRAAGQAATLV
ncbi:MULTISPECIES: flavin monoamine oxidase family protein [Streptomyces]|uniref:NAD(P)/FAD-dependent oxidoreductase n=1 Tax=Streptomyces doudnae TaxID=3075536 RepID=A0ABD5EFL2_9ACTN|nr:MULTISPECIES: NAD(P)/FAD-dependent oxidoreductase [unclassified Streptomyces]MDT0433390.1 NAD(P)/FAD-dependent oxidoreductase [Streptomyces sp. DSM 41981]MYQ62082.1 FAD-dependent oxidoreductase [Streptomyces sp. SID4950]SCD30081.1 Monoamine oxidase [Streptomyces sp. SolWspMP-5a-2]